MKNRFHQGLPNGNKPRRLQSVRCAQPRGSRRRNPETCRARNVDPKRYPLTDPKRCRRWSVGAQPYRNGSRHRRSPRDLPKLRHRPEYNVLPGSLPALEIAPVGGENGNSASPPRRRAWSYYSTPLQHKLSGAAIATPQRHGEDESMSAGIQLAEETRNLQGDTYHLNNDHAAIKIIQLLSALHLED